MSWQEVSSQYLEELSQLLQLDTLSFSGDNACGLAFDDRWFITIVDEEQKERWCLYGAWWDERDQRLAPEQVRNLMASQPELMFDQQVCLSFDSHEQQWLLCRVFFPQEAQGIEELEQILAQFLHLMESCHQWVQEHT